jgi:hypothetical protein
MAIDLNSHPPAHGKIKSPSQFEARPGPKVFAVDEVAGWPPHAILLKLNAHRKSISDHVIQ